MESLHQERPKNAMATMGGQVLMFREQDENRAFTGRTATFTGIQFSPLQYADLLNAKLHDKVVIRLNWDHARVAESTIPEIPIDEIASGKATLESFYSSKAVGLVEGGWLPSGLAMQENLIVLPDRCTVSELKGRFRAGVKRNQDDKDFLDFFSGSGIRINPLLYALEGNMRSNPTPERVRQQLEEALTALKCALPEAQLVPADTSSLQGIVGLAHQTQASMESKQQFLAQLAPRLQPPTSAKRKNLLWDEVLATAHKYGVRQDSLVVIAALSAIAVPNGASPAKRLLKLTAEYTAADAYNVLADLRSLEILMSLIAFFPDQRFMLCTGDRNMALFWAGLRASDFHWTDSCANYTLSPVDALLPDLTPAQRSSIFIDSADMALGET